jgi:hypothetical protein
VGEHGSTLFAVAAERVKNEKPELDVYSQLALLVWASISERKFDAELRSLLEDDGLRGRPDA